jgi:hypothetical protein
LKYGGCLLMGHVGLPDQETEEAAAAAARDRAAAADAEEEARAGAAGDDGESIRFWLRARDLAACAVYIRPPANDRPPHHLLPPPLFEATAGRAWPAGAQTMHKRWIVCLLGR